MRILSTTIAILSLAFAAQAADNYKVDPIHSVVQFKVGHKGAGFTHGRFDKFEGSFQIDQKDPNKASLVLTIQAASVNTGFEKRDQHIKSPDFLNAKQFPVIQFKTTKVKKTGAKTADIEGELTLLGVTKKVKAKATFTGQQGDLLGLEASTVIKRSEFGSQYGIPALGDEVHIYVAVEGGKQADNS